MSEEKKVKKAPAKKATTAKKTAAKTTAKKTTAKTAAKKPATKVAKTTKAATKTVAKKTATKAAAKTTKKTADKATTKKATAKTTAKKTVAKTTKKTATKKAPAKKATRAKRTGLKVEETVIDDAKLIKDLDMEEAENNAVPVDVPVESTSTNEFGTTTVSAEVSKAYVQQPVVETKTETVSQEEKKARKGGRKVIITMVTVIILAIAAFLGLWYFSKITAHNKIVDTLDKLKAGDQDTAVELIDLKNTLGLEVPTEETNTDNLADLLITNNQDNTTDSTTSFTNEIIQQNKKDEKDYIDFFKKMEYEIVEEKADFVDGYVKVKITNKNIGKLIKKYYIRAFALSIQTAFSTQQSSKVQDSLDKYLKELLTSEEIERVSTEVTFKLKRDGFEWKLDVNKEELCDAILPGLREQLKDFEF